MKRRDNRVIVDERAIKGMLNGEAPSAVPSEWCVIGSCLLDDGCIDDLIGIVPSGKAFSDETLGAIYDAIIELHQSGPIDMTVLLQSLRDKGTLELVGGPERIAEIIGSTPSSVTGPYHARVVREKAQRRALAMASVEILHYANDSTVDTDELTGRAESAILSVGEGSVRYPSAPISSALSECVDLIAEWQEGKMAAIPTGIGSLDAIIAGLRPKEVTIFAGRPSMGKSALAIQAAVSIASRGTPIDIYSMEMSRTSVMARMLCCESRVPLHRILNPKKYSLTHDEWRRIYAAQGAMSAMPMEICECSGITISALCAAVRRSVKRRKVAVVMIDYLQLINDPVAKAIGRTEEVASVSRQIHEMAMETGAAVLCVAQINRESQHGAVRRPRMADLKGSGDIEQDADTIVLLHREAYYHKDDPDWRVLNQHDADLAEMIVDKQRNGETGVAYARWDGPIQTFHSDIAVA